FISFFMQKLKTTLVSADAANRVLNVKQAASRNNVFFIVRVKSGRNRNQLLGNDFIIRVAIKDSRILKGIANNNIPQGNTPRLPITTHIIMNARNHERNVVWSMLNFFAIIYIATAKKSDQIPHTAPLTGSEGKVRPSAW
ncbi:MAG: hypothetical protein NTW31_02560, partial [Bacteroidetes bacterium]|nr:hypothetical protein [Bacteroidota bacterium]